ncbi:MAG TPA: hypothetical protein VIF62_19035, partial [Labilithrix sp.]
MLSLSVCVGCNDAPADPPGGNGALEQGNFTYACASAADTFCSGATPSTLPTGIALGSDFQLRFDAAQSTLEVDPAFFDLATDGTTLHAKQAGFGAVLVHAPSGEVIDFVNLHVHGVGALQLRGADAVTMLAVGETRAVHAAPYDSGGNLLAGALAYEWTSSDPNVVAVDATPDGAATLHALAAGDAAVRVVSGSTTVAL